MNDTLKDLLNHYNKAIDDCIHHNLLIDSLNAKLSKEFFILFRKLYDKIESTDVKELESLYKSVIFLRNVESFADLTKRIVFSATLDKSILDGYKHSIIDFYRIINYPIDLENFVFDYDDDFNSNQDT